MSERGCTPIRRCDVIEEQDESEIIEIKAYCYNIAGKVEVCQPKTCVIKRRKEIEEFSEEEPVDQPQTEKKNIELNLLESPEETCVPWKDTQQGGVEIVEGIEVQNDNAQSDIKENKEITISEDNTNKNNKDTNIINENIQKVENTNVTEKSKPTHQRTSKEGMPSEISDEKHMNQTGEKYQSTSEEVSHLNKASAASEERSFGKSETPKEILVAVDECQCCNCNPCECGPRGIVIENIIAALKTVQSSDQLTKLLHELSPEALAIIDDILMKEGEKAALWASGGAMNYIRGIEDDNFKEAVRTAWIKGYFDEMTSCHCLPHLCPCPGGHSVYGMKEETDEHKKYRQQKKHGRQRQKPGGKMNKDEQLQLQIFTHKRSAPEGEDLIIKRKLSDTCVCPPTKHYLSPASSGSSGDLTVRSRRMFWRDLMICSCPRLERTLAILKPDVVQFRDVVLRAIKKYGLDILSERRVQLTPEEASELYAKYYGRTQFPNMIVSISYAPIIAFSLGGISVVEHWKNIIGPDGVLPSDWFMADWIQREHGLMSDMPETLHASGNVTTAEKENRFFFPDSIIDPVMKNSEGVEKYVSKFVNPTLLKGLAILAKSKPTDPITFLAEWLLCNNPFQPNFPAIVSLAPT